MLLWEVIIGIARQSNFIIIIFLGRTVVVMPNSYSKILLVIFHFLQSYINYRSSLSLLMAKSGMSIAHLYISRPSVNEKCLYLNRTECNVRPTTVYILKQHIEASCLKKKPHSRSTCPYIPTSWDQVPNCR